MSNVKACAMELSVCAHCLWFMIISFTVGSIAQETVNSRSIKMKMNSFYFHLEFLAFWSQFNRLFSVFEKGSKTRQIDTKTAFTPCRTDTWKAWVSRLIQNVSALSCKLSAGWRCRDLDCQCGRAGSCVVKRKLKDCTLPLIYMNHRKNFSNRKLGSHWKRRTLVFIHFTNMR